MTISIGRVASNKHLSSFWLGLVFLICVGALPRFLSYGSSLPYINYSDEAHLYWTAQAMRGQFNPNYNRGYPPAFIAMNAATQLFLEARGQGGLAATVRVLRFLGVCVNLATIALIGMSARLLAGDLAGWIAAAFWAIASIPVGFSVYAIGETFLYPLAALCIYLAFAAILKDRRWYWSWLAGFPIILFEYRFFVFLLPGVVALLWKLRVRFSRRGWIRVAIGTVIAGLLLVLALYVLVPTYRGWLIQILTSNLWNFGSLFQYLSASVVPLSPLIVLVVSVLGLISWRKSGLSLDRVWVLLLSLLMILAICWISSAVVWSGDVGVRIKEIVPALMLVLIIFCALFVHSLRLFRRLRWQVVYGIGVGLLIFVPQLSETINFVAYSRLQDSHVVVREWADENLPPGTVIVDRSNNNTFNPYWGGIPYHHWFDWWTTKNFTQHSPEQWRAAGMTYMLLPLNIRAQMLHSVEGRAYLDQMLLLREFPPSAARQGPVTAMYRLWRMDVETQTRFEDGITLVGYDVVNEQLHPGGNMQFRFYWNAQTTPHDNYSLSIHLAPDDSSQQVAQYDGAPAVPERLTLTWVDPTETLISPVLTVNLPQNIAPGQYRVLVELYDFKTLVRLPLADSSLGDSLELMRVNITRGG